MRTVAEIESAIGPLTAQADEELAASPDDFGEMIRASAAAFSLYDEEEGRPRLSEPAPATSGGGPGGVHTPGSLLS